MRTRHLEILTEEPSMEKFLDTLLPRILPPCSTYMIHVFQGKHDLLTKLRNRLRGYAKWIPENYRVVVTDCDNKDCRELKGELESAAADSGLITRSQSGRRSWQVVNRIAVEELEAWYFGDWKAVRAVYPRVPPNIPRRAGYRNPDSIQGGTWEAFERIMKKHGYFRGGLRKMQAAGDIAAKIDPRHNCSGSFRVFYDAIMEATT